MKKKKYIGSIGRASVLQAEGSTSFSFTQWNKSLKKSVLVGTKGYKRIIWKNKKFLL